MRRRSYSMRIRFLFDSEVQSNWAQQYPTMTALYQGTRQTGSHVLPMTSLDGTAFVHFAKSNSWGQDLYDDLVGPYYKLGFEWETWRRSPYMPSYCSPTVDYQTLNVNSITIGGTGGRSFSYTNDHSKWGVSLTGNIVCVGGINRMQSQRSRGGSTMCINNKPLWTALHGVVAGADACGQMSPSTVKSGAPPKIKPRPSPVGRGHN